MHWTCSIIYTYGLCYSCFGYSNYKLPLPVQSIFKTKEAYYKAVGFQEENGKLENRDTYVERVRSCMKLYGALVQVSLFNIAL